VDKASLIAKCKKILLEKFELNNTEEQYLIALLYQIAQWSEKREVITYKDLLAVIQNVKDNSSKIQTNEAINKNLITTVSFEINDMNDDFGYYDGKSAKPLHIALDLPISREKWEQEILRTIDSFNISVIRSSSGQGKSTLAWKTSYQLKKSGYSIYQLNYCTSFDDVEVLVDFFNTRLKIGQIPLIVIDNLDYRVNMWGVLAERLFGLPIKIIITTREEDWYRYSADISKLNLKIIDIYLFRDEAKYIYERLKKQDKVNYNITNWQSAWEKIASKGLLIEYIYLLTHGNMIEERLSIQIKQLSQENDSAVKLEILRIIALADVMNIKIQTRKLTKYIQNTIGFNSDRGEIYKSLSKEYYIQFDKKYIEGLHPVRSKHLVDILHDTLPIEESLINLLTILDDEVIYDYFTQTPKFINNENKNEYLESASKILSKKKLISIVDAIDGLMHFESYNYWKKNQAIYDEVYSKGLIQLFVNFNPPFSNLNTFEELSKTEGIKEIFNFEDTQVSQICFYLSKELSPKPLDSYIGLEYLVKWFKITDNKIPKLLVFDENFILNSLNTKSLKEIENIFSYLFLVYPKEYSLFFEKYRDTIFSILKVKTDSVIIEEKNNELYIKYIADTEKIGKLNECSMHRIDALKNIFPQYNKYHTQAIYLPYPNEEIYKWAIENSKKSIPKENLFDKFDVHLNVIWRKTIMKQYSYESIYDWQEYQKNIREIFLKFTKETNRVFEYIIEGKKVKNIEPLYNEVFETLKTEKEFPVMQIKYNEKEPFKTEIDAINSFKSSYRNFMNQFVGILDKSDTLLLINLKNACKKLEKMQQSFDFIQNETYEYFDLTNLKEEEQYWYKRLKNTIEFYISADVKKVNVAKEYIQKWIKERDELLLDEINSIIDILEYMGFMIQRPLYIIEKGNFKEIAIGIKNLELNELEKVLFGIVDFSEIEIDYVNIIKLENDNPIGGFRVPKEFFEKIQNTLNGEEYIENDFGNPLPIIDFSDELLNSIGISSQNVLQSNDKEKETFFEVMYDIWKLIEYKNSLNKKSEIENNWFIKLKENILENIKYKKPLLREDMKNIVNNTLKNIESVSKENILLLIKLIMEDMI